MRVRMADGEPQRVDRVVLRQLGATSRSEAVAIAVNAKMIEV